jgi:anti-anti-sigma factor
MEINTRREKEATVVAVKGRLDASSASDFEGEVSHLMTGGVLHFVFELGQLEYISSAGLRTILFIAKQLEQQGGKILLSNLTDPVKEVFEISGFSAIIPIHSSVESALRQI